MIRPRRAVYFDLETGGVTEKHPDIQLAAIAIDEETWAEVDAFEAKIRFEIADADPEALKMNAYDREVWDRDAITPAATCVGFADFLNRHRSLELVSKRTGRPYGVAKLVGHNAASFDGPRLMSLFKKHEQFLPADPRVRDTCQRAFWYFDETGLAPPENYKLATLCRHFGIEVIESHEALADVRLTVKLARKLRELALERRAA